MAVAEVIPVVADPPLASLAVARPTTAVSDTPPPSTQSTRPDTTVDESSTAAEAGAALAAFMVQMSGGSSAPLPRLVPGADGPPLANGSPEESLPEVSQMSFPSGPTPPPGDQGIGLFADLRNTAAPHNIDPAIVATAGATIDPVASATAAEAGDVFIVDDSSTSADAGAALSAFLVQIRSSSSDTSPNSALASGGEPNSDRGSGLRSPEATQTPSPIPVLPGSPDIQENPTLSAGDAAAFGISHDVADLSSGAATNGVVGLPTAEPTENVDRTPGPVPPEADVAANARSRATEGTVPSSLPVQVRDPSFGSGRVPVDLERAAEVRASLQPDPKPAFEGRPVDNTSGARDELIVSEEMSSSGATRDTVTLVTSALRPWDLYASGSSEARVAERTSTSDGDGPAAEPGAALTALQVSSSSGLSPNSASVSNAGPDTSEDLGRQAPGEPQAPSPTLLPPSPAVLDPSEGDAGDATVLGNDLLAAGLLPLVMSLTPIRAREEPVPTDRVAPTAPVLASGSATADGGSGRNLLRYAQTAYTIQARAIDNEVPIDMSPDGLLTKPAA